MNLNVVDMNVIVLEGMGLYIVLGIILLMAIGICALAYAGIADDRKIEMLNAEIMQLKLSNNKLHGENWHYRLKYGELDPGKEVCSDVRNKV